MVFYVVWMSITLYSNNFKRNMVLLSVMCVTGISDCFDRVRYVNGWR